MRTLKKISFVLLALLFTGGIAFAQKNKKEKEEEPKDENKYKKLVDYFEKEKYANCLFQAQKYMENEKYNKDPEPYLYASMSYLAVYKDPEPFPLKKYPEFNKPLKDALSNFAKFRKRDKTGEVFAENKSFADELKTAVLEETANLHEKKDMSRLSSYSRDVVKAYEKDEMMMMIGGGYLVFTNNLSDGLKVCETSVAALKAKAAADKPAYNENERKGLGNAFIAYTDFLVAKKDNVNMGKAKEAITVAHDLLPDNEKITAQFEKLK